MDEYKSNSVLKTIAKMIGPGVGDDFFNPDLIWHINAAFSRLCTLGVGYDIGTPFKIEGPEDTWDDFIEDGHQEEVKEYVYLRVKMIFDPPASSIVKQAYDDRPKELEWILREVAEVGY